MARGWSKFCLLLWKNWVLQKRHPIQTLVEILMPVVFVVFLCIIRGVIKPKIHNDPTIPSAYSPMDLSETVIPFLGFQRLMYSNGSSIMKPKILYSPRNPMTDIIMNDASSNLRLKAQGVKSESELLHKFENMTDYERDMSLAGVVFEDITENDMKFTPEIKIKFRFPSELRFKSPNTTLETWQTASLFPGVQAWKPRNIFMDDSHIDPGYHAEGFLALQHSISLSLLQYLQPRISIPEIQLQKFPYPPFINDPLLGGLQDAMALILILSFAYTCFNTVKVIATEKELQLKESMKIMGLPNHLHWFAWFVKTYMFLVISVIIIVALLTVRWYPNTDVSVISKTDWSVILVFLLVYAVTVVCFCFMMSTFFSKANTAAAISGIVFILTYVPYTFLVTMYQTWGREAKLSTGLFLNTALALGLQIILMYEGSGDGLQWNTIWESVFVDDNIGFAYVLIMLIVDAALYLLIALYSEAVFPGNYGIPKPWYFLFQRSYWCGKSRKTYKIRNITNTIANDVSAFEVDLSLKANLKTGIRIKNLKKVYKNKIAVKDLSIDMYEDQITVLLGHNGAGKTTTINMLTGMITPSNGTAMVDNYDINDNMEIIRDNLGFCPQHNILFKELTVEEHIYFFAKLKGLNNEEAKEEITIFTKALELDDKSKEQAHTLSGGMKRKLSAALALCGNSKIVIFDEPTAGMDPAARRTFWNLLLANKSGRTILFTTHFMDEADLLGDRIAIISGGELKCCGSSFFLKKRYGVGYHLVIVKGPSCNVDSVTNLLQRHIPDICLYQNVASELTYLLEENRSGVFEPMLKELEENLDFIGIISYGISLTTMEEVFMKNYEENGIDNYRQFNDTLFDMPDEETVRYSYNFKGNCSEKTTDLKLVSGSKLYMYQAYAILIKHMFYTISTWILLLSQIIAPVICLTFYFLHIEQLSAVRKQEPNLNFTLEAYGTSTFTPVELLFNISDERIYIKQYKDIIIPNKIVDLTTGTQSSYMTQYMLNVSEDKRTFRTFREKYIVGATFEQSKSNNTSSITAWYNDQPFHSSPLSLNIVYNSIMKDLNYSLHISNHPLPANLKSQMMNTADFMDCIFNVTFTFSMFLSFVSSFYVMFQLKERVSKSKHLQSVSGVKNIIYWCVSYIWDFLTYLIIISVAILTIFAHQREEFSSPEQLGRHFAVMVCFAFACLPQAYVFSYLSNTTATGFMKMFMYSIITGPMANLLTLVLKLPILEVEYLSDIFTWIFMSVFPIFNVSSSVLNLFSNEVTTKNCEQFKSACDGSELNVCCEDPDICPNGKCAFMSSDYFGWQPPGIGRNIMFFLVDGILFLIIHICIEAGLFKKLTGRTKKEISEKESSANGFHHTDSSHLTVQEDYDVVTEREYIKNTSIDILNETYQIIMIDLTKYYDKFLAVDHLCVGVKQGECFGLLGVNGAGKTSTFKMLTGDEPISFGEVYVNGFNIKNDMRKVQKIMGYCPQFDAVIQDLTGRETLKMYCLLRGIPLSSIPYTTESLAKELLLTKHIDKKVKEYSGGNKRKLSTAVALIGDPPIIYLDEPTAGMDPVAKRHLWNVICKLRDRGKCIVLTSHSMEECEALCTRIAIMVNGQFKCLGSTQHLKTKFAEGYTLTIKTKTVSEEIKKSIMDFTSSFFPGTILKEEHQDMMVFFIPASNLTWSRIFGIIENSKESLDIIDYSLGQTSLEQVFLSFAKAQIKTEELAP